MENDQKSKCAALRLCEKHPGETLCVEWNPENNQWRAVTHPDGQTINPLSLQLDGQAKFVLVGHFREDKTIAALSPETLAAAQVKLLKELGVKAPRKISLTGVCYTAPEMGALYAAADSLAGRLVSALHKEGISTPVTSIDGEVIVNAQGRKETVLSGGTMTEPASQHKVILMVDDTGKLIAGTLPLHSRLPVSLQNMLEVRHKPSPGQQRSPMTALQIGDVRTMQRISERKSMQAKPDHPADRKTAPSTVASPLPVSIENSEPPYRRALPLPFLRNPLKR